MKVAFVANTCWNIFNFRKGLVDHFLARGDQVLIIAPSDEYTDRVKSWGVKFFDTPLDGTSANPIKDFGYLSLLKRIFRQEKPEVVLSYTIKANIYSCLAARSFRTKVICNVSGLGTVFLTKNLASISALGLYKFAFRYASHIFFQNEDDHKLFASKIKVSKEKVGLLPGSGIDLDAFDRVEMPASPPIRFLMIARLIVEKGVREYANAAAAFLTEDRVSFTLIGKLDEGHSRSIKKQELDEWIEKKWLTYLPHSDTISDVIKAHHVVVLPSYREGTPRTLLEGAAHGRPLLASDVPGCKEVVQDGYNGFLFEVEQADSIVEAVKRYLLLSTEEQIRFAKNSRALVERVFDIKEVIRAYQGVIDRIVPLP